MSIDLEWKAPPSDVKRLTAIISLLDNEYTPPIHELVELQSYCKKLVSYADICYATFSKDRDVGICAVYLNQKPYGFISSIGIIRDFQRHHIGQRLLEAVFERAKELGFSGIRLEVYKKNERAIAFYSKNLFVPISEDKDHYILQHDFSITSASNLVRSNRDDSKRTITPPPQLQRK